MPLNVAFYSDALAASQRYGLSRYASELFQQLRGFAPDLEVQPVSAQAPLDPAQPGPGCRHPVGRRLPCRRRFLAGCWSLFGGPKLEHWVPWADVVHCVELDYRVPTRKPLVVTIHDLGPLTHPKFFRPSHPWLLKIALRSAVRHARAILCVSQATADAVEGWTKTSLGDRLRVIPEGVSADFFKPVPCECLEKTDELARRRKPFFLWTGSLNPRKNLRRLIAAFEEVALRLPHHLVLAGGLGWDSENILEQVRNSPVRARIHLPGRVSDFELRGLYQRASAFLFPSLMEGFGLPILEAMAAECPVVTSNRSSLPEVAGDAAFLVNPEKVEEIAAAMHCLATDETFAARLRHQGRVRAEEFRWEHCAAAVAEVYRQVGQSHRRATRIPTTTPTAAVPREASPAPAFFE